MFQRLLDKRESMEDWEIPAKDVSIGRKIGSGSFGTVFKGGWFGMFRPGVGFLLRYLLRDETRLIEVA